MRADEAPYLSLLVTFAMALGIEGFLALSYATTFRSIQPGYENFSWTVLGYQVNAVRFFAFLLSLAMLGLLYLIMHRTKFGWAIRATVQNPMSAQLLGVNAKMVAAFGFGLGTATAAASGAVFGLVSPFNPGSHYDLISRLLTIVVLGGLGSIGGSIIAAMVMGVGSAVIAMLFSPVWSDFSFFVVLLLVLLVRPHGALRRTHAGRDMTRAGLHPCRRLLRRVRAAAVRRRAAVDREHADLHAHVCGPGERLEPARRLCRLSLPRPCRLLRHRRLCHRHRLREQRRQRLRALLPPAGDRRRRRAA